VTILGNVGKNSGALSIVTWNVHGLLTGSRELALANFLETNDVDIMIATETEIPDTAAPFATTGYITFFPPVKRIEKERTRMLMLVKSSLVTLANVRLCPNLMAVATCQMVWITMDPHTRHGQQHGGLTEGGTYLE
jgi:exonuclease III